MTERDALSPKAARARQALAVLDDEAPASAFRERLRADFVAGTMRAATPEAGHEADRLARRDDERERRLFQARARSRHPGGFGRPLVWLTAAAAAVAVAVSVWSLNAGPRWTLDAITGDGVATVDGRPIPLSHVEDLAAALTPGARVRVPPGATLALRSPGVLAIQMTPETDATVPPVPGRWFARAVDAEIRSGEWRIMTGPGFHGASVAIATPAAHVEITGTTLAVICEPEGTCVCVYEGRVRVGRDRSDMVAVTSGHRRYVWNDTTKNPEMNVIRPTESVALPEFRTRMQATMTR